VAVFRRGRIWWYDFRFKGVRIRESTSAITRAEALQAEAIRRAELAQGKALIQAVLRILFNFAIRLRKATRNPVTRVRFFAEKNRHMRVLTTEEEGRYFKVAPQCSEMSPC